MESVYAALKTELPRFGTEDWLGEADYWILGDNYGFRSNKICIHRFSFLTTSMIATLREIVARHDNWEILVAIDIPGKEEWPPMGVYIRAHEIVDQPQREYFPPEYRDVRLTAD